MSGKLIKSPLNSQSVKMLLRQIVRKNQRNKFLLKELTHEFTACCQGSVQQIVADSGCDGTTELLNVAVYAPGVNGSQSVTVQVLGDTSPPVWSDVFTSSGVEFNDGLAQVTGIDVSSFVGLVSVRVLVGNDPTSEVEATVNIVTCT